jgi:hypothetical protein
MSTSFSVRVVNVDGEPVSGIKVYANFGIMHGGITERTDDDGWASFEASGDYCSVELFVDGDNEGDHSLEDGETYSFTLAR